MFAAESQPKIFIFSPHATPFWSSLPLGNGSSDWHLALSYLLHFLSSGRATTALQKHNNKSLPVPSYESVTPQKNRVILISFLSMFVYKGFLTISRRHCYSTVFPRAVKPILAGAERSSAPRLSSSTPTQNFLSLTLAPRPGFMQKAERQRAPFGLCSQFLGGAADELTGAARARGLWCSPPERTAETL